MRIKIGNILKSVAQGIVQGILEFLYWERKEREKALDVPPHKSRVDKLRDLYRRRLQSTKTDSDG